MEIIDISWPITQSITEYKNKKYINIVQASDFKHDKVREKLITIHSHTGTHIDAPSHFLHHGKSLDQLDLSKFYGPCKVFDLSDIKEKITDKDLEKFNINENDIILLKTKNSVLHENINFTENFVYLDKSGAQYLANKKIKTFGFDYLGIERNQPEHNTHLFLLEAEIPIIEGLRLKDVIEDEYILCCFPILIKEADGAPARAILIVK
ncbi:cyclase family protein [Candidatus Dependentiae bacterium]|nr:cyclase family protein [Candidatus Dependentiae bacterium]MBU4387679.1 cyclase family protein [Candidatus Dependentiae bacterium]MCG2756617.1 cyclase family protein [Candidatus Dependentiae bacterium]